MMTDTAIEQLSTLKLHAMVAVLEQPVANECTEALSFIERAGLYDPA
jgi:hypothetical protein